jgi:tetratricopeptide (TPR) repeat protein
MEIVLGAIGALGVIWAIITFPVRWWWNRRKPPPASREDVARLEQKVDRLAEYLDGLAEAKNPDLRAAFEDGRRLQLEGYQQEGHAAQSAEKHREAIGCFSRALGLAETDSQRAALHNLRGNSYANVSQHKEAQADYEQVISLSQRIPEPKDAAQARAAALGNLGNVRVERGELNEAEEHFKQALKIQRDIGDRLGEAAVLGNLGIVYRYLGDLDKAEDHHKQALNIASDIGDRLCEANALCGLGIVYTQRGGPGDLGKAEKHYKQALKIHREIDNRLGEAQDLGNLGIVYKRRGELGKAEEHYKQALEIAREIGNRLGEATVLGNLGFVYALRGDTKNAREYLQQAQALYLKIGAGGDGPETVRRALEELERHQRERGE